MSFRQRGVGYGLFFEGVKKQTVAHPSPPKVPFCATLGGGDEAIGNFKKENI